MAYNKSGLLVFFVGKELRGSIMVFGLMRHRMKLIVIIVSVAFVGTLLYAGGVSFFSGKGGTVNAASVATVNGTDISYADFYQAYYSIVRQQEMYGQSITGQMVGQVQYYALDQLVNQELLIQAAENAKIKVEERLVNERYKAIQDNYPSKALFEEDLRNSGLTSKELKTLLRNSLKIEALQTQLTEGLVVTDEDIKASYEEVNARHILIKPEDDGDEAKTEALERANQFCEELKAGADFAAMAKEYSADSGSKDSGGELGWFGRGKMVEPFETAAFAAKINEIVGPVESQFGYHIIQVTERKEAAGEEFEKAKSELRDKLLQEKSQAELSQWFRELKDTAAIEIKDPGLLGQKMMLEGAWQEAVDAFKAAILANEADPYLHSSLGQAYDQLGEADLALEQYELAAEKIGTDAELWLVVGMLHQQRENLEKAVAAYRQASDAAPMNLLLHLQLMNAYEQLGEEELVKVEEGKIASIKQAYEERQKALEELQKAQAEEEAAKDGDESALGETEPLEAEEGQELTETDAPTLGENESGE
jgi:parvulin-like peptidyl-prolyl isomerase